MQEQQEMWKYKGREINNNINKQGLWTFGEWYRKNFEGKKIQRDTKHLTRTEILPPQVMQKNIHFKVQRRRTQKEISQDFYTS